MQVPYFRPVIGDAEIQAVADVLKSGWLTTGPKVQEFEQLFARSIGHDVEALAVTSATAGLHLAAEACGLMPGDEVLVPTLTFTATAEVIAYIGARVVLVDCDPHQLDIDLTQAERLLTPRTKMIMVVHFAGRPSNMENIWAFADHFGLKVIEDAAHAFPAKSHGTMIGGGRSSACIFSFYANKTMTTGEGGMLVTRDRDLAARARTMRTHGLNRDAFDRFRDIGASWEYDIVAPGYKYNLTDIAAALGIVQLGRAHDMRDRRQKVADLYLDSLRDLPLDLPMRAEPGDLHAWHLFPISVREDARMDRNDVIGALTERGIGTSVHYKPLHKMSYWQRNGSAAGRSFPASDRYFSGAISLPIFPEMTTTEVEYVCSSLHELLGD